VRCAQKQTCGLDEKCPLLLYNCNKNCCVSINFIKTLQHEKQFSSFELFSSVCGKTVMAKLRGTFLQLFITNAHKRGINVQVC
jgi:hypothetical protein